jgi:hypothetical protein
MLLIIHKNHLYVDQVAFLKEKREYFEELQQVSLTVFCIVYLTEIQTTDVSCVFPIQPVIVVINRLNLLSENFENNRFFLDCFEKTNVTIRFLGFTLVRINICKTKNWPTKCLKNNYKNPLTGLERQLPVD